MPDSTDSVSRPESPRAATPDGSTAPAATPGAAPARRRYPSDVTDLQWRHLQPLATSAPAATGHPRETDLRLVLSALNYRWQTGCPWRMLPHDFPPWGTVYAYHRSWERSGVLPEIRAIFDDRRLR